MKRLRDNNGTLKCKVLIVDDSKTVNEILSTKFTSLGCYCFKAFSLAEAKDILKMNMIDYLILDINLPDGKGYKLLNEIDNGQTKIFILTTQSDDRCREISFKKGVIDFIIKDNNFFYKIDQISQNIEKLEKNKNETILIVDDSLTFKAQLKEIFENRNYNVKLASNKDEALKILSNNPIDLMLLDVELKNGSGIDFLQKEHELITSELKIPVIVVSGKINVSTARDSFKAGAVDIIKKPYVIEELILKVDSWIDYKRKEKELIQSTQLLQEYKNAVDESAIVSKYDSKGIITYVNEQFCTISGYTKDELIGSEYTITSHPDTPDFIFDDIWHTINNLKKTWTGKIKDRRKDGSYYWIDGLIKPILDKNGNIEEFISLRNDITEQEKVKEYFKTKLEGSKKDLTNSIKLSKEYEKAINASNILSRTDLKGKITYANDKFIEISEYSKNDLIGASHNIIKHPDTPDEVFIHMWKRIKAGEIFSGILKNLSKSGKTFWVNTTIVPIKNEDNEIIEYMEIRHDISEIFNLHKEIENTQKEIIYKMGEIGESRSKETGNHVKRVAEYSRLLAILSGLNQKEADILFTASPMHDIGKVGIPDSILKSDRKLTKEEFEVMKTHAMIGYNILKGSNREVLKAAAIVSKEHHEKYDGSGYPYGLKGENIHIYGRITAVADVFDALASDRCYKKAWDDNRIFNLFKEESGKHFDPKLINLFFEHKDKFFDIRKKYKD